MTQAVKVEFFNWFYVKSHFGELKRSKNVYFEVLNLDVSKFEQLSSPKLTKIQKSVSKIAKNDIFRPFEFPKIWFYVKSEWR